MCHKRKQPPKDFFRRKRRERGSAVLETVLCMFLLFLILFGLLQIFYFSAGQMFTDYAALRGIRSHIVGFREYLVRREVRVNAIGGSGQLVTPRVDPASYDPVATEKSYVNSYLNGYRYMEYEFWEGRSGQTFDSFKGINLPTSLSHRVTDEGKLAKLTVRFKDYALLILSSATSCCSSSGKSRITSRYIPEEENAQGGVVNFLVGNINLEGSAYMKDHSRTFLDYGGGSEN